MEFQNEVHDDVNLSSPKPMYRECLKNHAVSLGGYAVDGCRDFLPAGADGTPEALHCAACNCHRNFHRQVSSPVHEPLAIAYRTPTGQYHVQRPAPPSNSGGSSVGAGGNILYLRDEIMADHEDVANYNGGMLMGNGGSSAAAATRKRFRTKFTAEHKEQMLALAEKIGWKIRRHDEEAVHLLCEETGIPRNVFKIWMHNNKHTIGRKP